VNPYALPCGGRRIHCKASYPPPNGVQSTIESAARRPSGNAISGSRAEGLGGALADSSTRTSLPPIFVRSWRVGMPACALLPRRAGPRRDHGFKLQDPSDKCYSMCDERLFAVFQKEHIYMIRMDSALLWRALGKKRRESGEEDEGEEERRRKRRSAVQVSGELQQLLGSGDRNHPRRQAGACARQGDIDGILHDATAQAAHTRSRVNCKPYTQGRGCRMPNLAWDQYPGQLEYRLCCADSTDCFCVVQ
jgi:hypothetical protein